MTGCNWLSFRRLSVAGGGHTRNAVRGPDGRVPCHDPQ